MTKQYVIQISLDRYNEYLFCGFNGRHPQGVSTMCIDGTQKQYTKIGYAQRAKERIEKYYANSPHGNVAVEILTLTF